MPHREIRTGLRTRAIVSAGIVEDHRSLSWGRFASRRREKEGKAGSGVAIRCFIQTKFSLSKSLEIECLLAMHADLCRDVDS